MSLCVVMALITPLALLSTATPSCGKRAVYTQLAMGGIDASIKEVEKRFADLGISEEASFLDLQRAVESFGGHAAVAIGLSVDEVPAGSIIHLVGNPGHFSVILEIDSEFAYLGEAPLPPVRISRSLLRKSWSGTSMVLFQSAHARDAFVNQTKVAELLSWSLWVSGSLVGFVLSLPYFRSGWLLAVRRVRASHHQDPRKNPPKS